MPRYCNRLEDDLSEMRTFRNQTQGLDDDSEDIFLRFHRPYMPNTRAQAARITREEWKIHEPRIRELHEKGYTSEGAREVLRHETRDRGGGSFCPS